MIGAILGGLEIGSAVLGSVMSFSEAGRQKKLYEQAQADAAKAMVQARKALSVNYYAGLSIPTQAYKMESDNLKAAAAQELEAGREGDQRGVAATAGRVQAAVNEGARAIRSDMAGQLYDLNKLTQQENKNIAENLASLDLQEAKGAQLAARDAKEARAAAMTQGFSSLTDATGKAVGMLPLYEKTKGAKIFSNLQNDYNKAIEEGTLSSDYYDQSGNPLTFQQAVSKMGNLGSDISSLTPIEFQDYVTKMPLSQIETLYKDKSFMPNDYYLKGTNNYLNEFDFPGVKYRNFQKK